MTRKRTRFFVFSLIVGHNTGTLVPFVFGRCSMTLRARPTALVALLLCASTVDCRCGRERPAARLPDASLTASEPEFAFDDADGGEDGGAPLPRCTLGAPTLLAPASAANAAAGASADAGRGSDSIDRFEAVALRALPRGDFAAYVDRDARSIALARRGGARATALIDPQVVQAISLTERGASVLVMAVSEVRGARVQRAFLGDGESSLRLIATRTGLVDDAYGVAAATVRDGALVAWDEAPTEGRGAVRVQRWTEATRADPPVLTASAPEHDASDPVLAALPDGGAILAYLSLQEVAVETANQSAADIVLRALAPDGTPRGAPVTITPTPRTRFGVALRTTVQGRWVAWRVGSESDHEGLGDGGQVAAVALGDDLRPLRTPEYLSERGAVPAGPVAVLADGDRAEVYWTERRGEELVTVRRRLTREGRLDGPARDEPALGGVVPFGGGARDPRVSAAGPRGEPAVALAQCPP
jgi:hypothetical protein